MRTKTCFKCDTEKPLGDFYKHPQMADGHVNKCKDCNKRDVRENRSKKRLQYSAYERKRFQDQERKAQIKRYQQKRRRSHPEKYQANYAVTNAVKAGRLVRLPCEVCGNEKSQAHHENYSKPFTVRWLCFRHHREEHGQVVFVETSRGGI